MSTKLSINLNKVALLRNQRDVGYPSVTEAAVLIVDAGADGITVHPRPDQRHTRISDVHDLARLFAERFAPEIEFNIEGNPTAEFVDLVRSVKPDQVTLVPDDPDQSTSDHGWDLAADGERLEPIIAALGADGIRVSVFLDPDPPAAKLARQCGADRIELYTEPYASAFAKGRPEEILALYAETAEAAIDQGLAVNAGHDLNLDNLPAFKRRVPGLAEVSIGHAFTADALKLGYRDAVRAYLAALR